MGQGVPQLLLVRQNLCYVVSSDKFVQIWLNFNFSDQIWSNSIKFGQVLVKIRVFIQMFWLWKGILSPQKIVFGQKGNFQASRGQLWPNSTFLDSLLVNFWDLRLSGLWLCSKCRGNTPKSIIFTLSSFNAQGWIRAKGTYVYIF